MCIQDDVVQFDIASVPVPDIKDSERRQGRSIVDSEKLLS
jgi:hypothetical protein